MKGIEFTGEVKNGHLPPVVRQRIGSLLTRMEGKQISVRVAPYRRKRTLPQNNYYKGIVVPQFRDFINSFGNSASDDFADKVIKAGVDFTRDVKMPDGSVVKEPRSTTELDTKEMSEFTESAIAWIAMEWNLEILLPNEGIRT